MTSTSERNCFQTFLIIVQFLWERKRKTPKVFWHSESLWKQHQGTPWWLHKGRQKYRSEVYNIQSMPYTMVQVKASQVTVCSSLRMQICLFSTVRIQAQVNTSVQSKDANLPAARYAAGPMCHWLTAYITLPSVTFIARKCKKMQKIQPKNTTIKMQNNDTNIQNIE